VIKFSKHAKEALAARGIELAWIRDALAGPDRTEIDPRHPDRCRSYKAIASFGGRVLRVVHRASGEDIVIITVHFDRGAKR